jgi:hypothetical protein
VPITGRPGELEAERDSFLAHESLPERLGRSYGVPSAEGKSRRVAPKLFLVFVSGTHRGVQKHYAAGLGSRPPDIPCPLLTTYQVQIPRHEHTQFTT